MSSRLDHLLKNLSEWMPVNAELTENKECLKKVLNYGENVLGFSWKVTFIFLIVVIKMIGCMHENLGYNIMAKIQFVNLEDLKILHYCPTKPLCYISVLSENNFSNKNFWRFQICIPVVSIYFFCLLKCP